MESQDFNVVSIQDTILAGMYSNGYTDLETVNKDLFVSVNSWSKLFAKIDSNDVNIIKTLLISLSQSLINFEKKVLYICESEDCAKDTNDKFTNVLKFVDNVNSGINDQEARLIFTTVETLKEYQDIGYVIIDNSLSQKLVEKLNYSVNYAIFIQSDLNSEISELVQKLNSIETEIFIPQDNQDVEEVNNQVVEEVNNQVVEEVNNQDVEEVNNQDVEEVNNQDVEEVNNQDVESDSDSDSSNDSIDLKEILKGLNVQSLEEINKNKQKEEQKKKNRSLLLKLASRRR